MQVLATPVASGAPHLARGLQRGLAGREMTEQVDGIVLRHADQREAEGQRDAVHAVEQRADRDQAGERRRHQWQRA